jgi:hypothetical protein
LIVDVSTCAFAVNTTYVEDTNRIAKTIVAILVLDRFRFFILLFPQLRVLFSVKSYA